jgi:hypothetical protein
MVIAAVAPSEALAANANRRPGRRNTLTGERFREGERGQTGLPADFRQTAPEIHGSLVSPQAAIIRIPPQDQLTRKAGRQSAASSLLPGVAILPAFFFRQQSLLIFC